MPLINPEKIAQYIRDVSADKIEPRFRQLKDHEISTKSGPSDLVTIADLEAEVDLTRIFKDIIPGSHVVGEEAVSKNEIDMGLLATEKGYIWVIDPVDGTNNFAAGHPTFGTIVNLVKDGQSIQGWIYDSQQGRMGITEAGGGVEVNGDQKKFPVMAQSLKDTRGFISRKFLPKKIRQEMEEVLSEYFSNVETYMCCAHEYLDILEGDAYFSMYSRIRPWDHLTGAMMMREAGGHVRKWDGSDYNPGDERGGLIVAPDADVWEEIYELLLSSLFASATGSAFVREINP